MSQRFKYLIFFIRLFSSLYYIIKVKSKYNNFHKNLMKTPFFNFLKNQFLEWFESLIFGFFILKRIIDVTANEIKHLN